MQLFSFSSHIWHLAWISISYLYFQGWYFLVFVLRVQWICKTCSPFSDLVVSTLYAFRICMVFKSLSWSNSSCFIFSLISLFFYIFSFFLCLFCFFLYWREVQRQGNRMEKWKEKLFIICSLCFTLAKHFQLNTKLLQMSLSGLEKGFKCSVSFGHEREMTYSKWRVYFFWCCF